MKLLKYMRQNIWDMILTGAMIFALSTTIFSGFYISQSIVRDYLPTAVMSLAATAVMMLIAYDRRSIRIGTAAAIALLAAAGLLLTRIADINILTDRENNPYLHYILLLICAVSVFLLSRTRLGNALLYAAGAIAICLIQFLYQTNHIVCMLIFLTACCVMQVYRNYIYNIMHSRTVKVAQGSAVLTTAIVCLLIIAVGSGIFYGMIKPLDPPKKELKIITKYMSLKVLNKIGVATTQTIRDPNRQTSNKNDRTNTAKKEAQKKHKAPNGNKNDQAKASNENSNNPTRLDNSKKGFFHTVKYSLTVIVWLLVVAMIIAALLAAVLIKLWLRRRWLRKVLSYDRKRQIREFYLLWLKKFRQLGIRKSQEETPYEFAERAGPHLWLFREGMYGIEEITGVLVRSEYGDREPTAEEYSGYLDFHRYFYRNCREYLGKFKYIIKFFIL